jgi:ABC-type transport system substrate-binding protein
MFSRLVTVRLMLGLALACVLTLAACASGSGSGAGGSTGKKAQEQDKTVLTIASNAPPSTLNPALGGNGDPPDLFYELDYEPLIYMEPNGTYGPGLATSWGYVGSGNTVFDLTLRSGVKFSDGTPLTAAAVKESLEYYGTANGPFADRISQFKSITVTGPLSLRITLKTANPDLPFLLDQRETTGDIISPKALRDPSALGTTSDGAGQYVLDASATVTNQTYTYVPNPNYWNKPAVHWKKVVIKVITDSNAALDAMAAGEVDYTFGTQYTASSAAEDGFTVSSHPYIFAQVQIMDRNGQTVKPLGNEKVRQALSYALDRPAIATALFGQYGTADDEISLPGWDGYSPSLADTYSYDLTKAKQLMTQAGYASGFSLQLLAYNLQPGETTAAQAIAAAWGQIGVNVKIVVSSTLSQYVTQLEGGKYPATMFFYGANPMYVDLQDWIGNGYANPYHVDDATIDTLNNEASAAASTSVRSSLYDQIESRWQQLEWNIPFASVDKILLVRPGLCGTKMSGTYVDPDPALMYAC